MAFKAGLLLLLVCILLCHYQVTSEENVTKQHDHEVPVPQSLPSKEAPAPLKPLHHDDDHHSDHKKCHDYDGDDHHPDHNKCHHDSPTSPYTEAPSKSPAPKNHGHNCDTVCAEHCKSDYSKDTCSKDCKKCCEESFKCVAAPMHNDNKCKKTWDFSTVNGKKTKCP